MSGQISIGFSTPRRFNPISWLVRKLTGSKASHAWFLYFDADFEMWMVMEAHELGFRLIPFKRFNEQNNVVAVYSTNTPLDAGLKMAAQWLGTEYDFGGLIGMAWVILGRMLKHKWRNPLENSHAMFCSEMAVSVLQSSGVGWSKQVEPHETSPQDLYDLFVRECRFGGDATKTMLPEG